MPSEDVLVSTPDGQCAAVLQRPDGVGPWPAVLMYPDAGSLRGTFSDMAERLSALGYVVLVPDVYYRNAPYEPFDVATVFTDPDERQRLGELASALTRSRQVSDAGALLDFLAGRSEVAAGPVGTVGYCMGGRAVLNAAEEFGDRIGAAASFHGGNLAADGDVDSPHQYADGIRGTVYIAAADNDDSFPAEQADRLSAAFDATAVTYSMETYSAAHGFAVPDNPTFDEAASERHWSTLEQLFGATLIA